MAYINAEKTAEFRAELKKAFPSSEGWKLSVTNDNHSTICVAILEAPINFLEGSEKTYKDVNVYWFRDHYAGQQLEQLQKIYDICMKGNHNNSDAMSDYFDVGWYFDLSIGRWDRPFKYIESATTKPVADSTKPEFEKVEVKSGEVHIIDYSERAIAVVGDTKPIKEKLSNIGGKFNTRLSCGPGWIFPKSKLEIVTKTLAA